ncbi:hypothetical protein BIY22_00660 [Vibrio panuliri]|uniref:HTH araC/xylS-type domain-containing protein n=1 Tax=Vibrio panuliri TaxID=1381081 RepID=A0A1Q9HQC6_9VIBR|nr:AraC family transcriptional regulator [Vibrio panuliri]OLQ93036.1 hypothetical protein BIY22_00660 [Vibrio panuliri]
MSRAVIDIWSSYRTEADIAWIMPDGCQDVILSLPDNGAPSITISTLHHTATAVHIPAQQHMIGLRLSPGFNVSSLDLMQLYRYRYDTKELAANIEQSATPITSQLKEALSCLHQHISVQTTADTLGVSCRTLQRLLKTNTGQSPLFWARLARVRRAAQMLLAQNNASETAYLCHYADQAHMSREIKHWFGVTPQQLLSRPDIIHQLQAPGY